MIAARTLVFSGVAALVPALALAQVNGTNQGYLVTVGHADRFGTAEYNQKLSMRRVTLIVRGGFTSVLHLGMPVLTFVESSA